MDLKGIMLSEISQTEKRQIAYDFTCMQNLKKINERTKQKQTQNQRATDGCHMEGGLGGWVERGQGLRSTTWRLQNSHGDVKYSIGKVVIL